MCDGRVFPGWRLERMDALASTHTCRFERGANGLRICSQAQPIAFLFGSRPIEPGLLVRSSANTYPGEGLYLIIQGTLPVCKSAGFDHSIWAQEMGTKQNTKSEGRPSIEPLLHVRLESKVSTRHLLIDIQQVPKPSVGSYPFTLWWKTREAISPEMSSSSLRCSTPN
ncbi:hypothetical protein SODALDRAFT_199995 [Sodiomyces alkalinus F11]|uniref:Uncharacterized protein n=1 Tax=Sodiomyces alkalinus (strain CBS 110278 / VKM F-3762 / F11) TaxID=1314773 RepID=A0A3N2PSS0_SODAK|nr:hypothetical protein SODALDRAFT_199995 [Sodiomyces alkalinus F11]ROT37562.1 hypothetical protein SODALDRAFT_199995 [Sodiomyces alkalinus F11]